MTGSLLLAPHADKAIITPLLAGIQYGGGGRSASFICLPQ
jgi:hypothetical protein